MEKELQEQFEKVLSDNVGNFWAGTDNIISFIDQNFIGKQEKAWIIGSLISFKKPKYESPFFKTEEVIVIRK